MSVNHNGRWAVLVAIAAIAVLSSCGGAKGPSSSTSNPKAAVQLAAGRMSGESFHMTATQQLNVDTSGVSGAGGQSLPSSSSTETIKEDVQDPTHVSMTMTYSGRQLHMVVYGGDIYVSADGTSYQVAPFLSSLVGQFSTTQYQDFAQHLINSRDVGASTQDGVATEEYQGSVDSGYFTSLAQKVFAAMSGSLGVAGIPSQALTAMLAAFQFKDVGLTWYVDGTEHLVRQLVQMTVQIDMGKMSSALGGATAASGTAIEKTSMDVHFTDWGAKITVPQPRSTGTLTPQGFSQLLSQAPAASS